MSEQKHFEVIRPLVTRDHAVKLCSELYNFHATTCKELVSYDDRNFLVTGSFGGPGGDCQSFVLKISNSVESKGDFLGANFTLTYLPGTPMGELPMTPDMLESVAKEIGRVNKHLTVHFLTDPGANAAELNRFSLLRAPTLLNYTQYVHDEARQRMVREIVHKFSALVTQEDGNTEVPFTKAFIHGDPNESNILVDGSPPRFSGLLDWQDSHSAHAVFDLALLVMYASYVAAKADPAIEPFSLVAPPLIRGYTLEFPLDEAELHHLPLLVATRFAQSLTLGAYAYARDPGNDYLLSTACSWSTLERLWNGHKHRLDQLGCDWLEWERCSKQ